MFSYFCRIYAFLKCLCLLKTFVAIAAILKQIQGMLADGSYVLVQKMVRYETLFTFDKVFVSLQSLFWGFVE